MWPAFGAWELLPEVHELQVLGTPGQRNLRSPRSRRIFGGPLFLKHKQVRFKLLCKKCVVFFPKGWE